ncbi:MAG: hypothetical protein IID44_30810 [Planctomycetes bacterium]|nr:hypothetical protein [Planctomycetota bacterium]
MARKVVSRKKLRAEAEAAEKAPKKAKKKTTRKKKTKKDAAEIRLKAFWGVFSQSLKRVAVFDYSQRKAADKKMADLNAKGKAPHFVQLVKEAIEVE